MLFVKDEKRVAIYFQVVHNGIVKITYRSDKPHVEKQLGQTWNSYLVSFDSC